MENTLEIKNLSMNFGGLKAVDNLSFSIQENEIFGLIGPNGAGKTTVFNCITQFYRPNEGSILFNVNGKPVNLVGKPVHNIIKLGLVRTFQNVEIVRELSLIDNVLIGAHSHFKATIFEQVFTLPRARREERLFREKAREALNFFGIEDRKDMIAGSQPYGVLKKTELARTLMSDPKLIIMDEPAAGLNEAETEEMAAVIKDIRDKFNYTILLIEHDMKFVMGLCDRIVAISFGQFLNLGTPDVIKNCKIVQEAYLGEDEA